jgi:hypothetical protein
MKRLNALSALLLLSFVALPVTAAESEKDEALAAEAKEAAEEDTANIGKDFAGGYELIARGKFKLYAEGESENPQVIGLFSADGKIYQVKLENEGLKKELAPFNGKDVGLAGKLRNKGKYLVIQMLMNSAPPPDSFRNPRGL